MAGTSAQAPPTRGDLCADEYDIVFGPVGNDDITFLLEQFTNGFITKERLREGLEFKKASDQYSFYTQRAIAYLKKCGVQYV